MDEVTLYKKHFDFHSNLDYVDTVNLSDIKEISKRINFASITTENEIFNNKGNLYHRRISDVGDYITYLTLDYIIKPREIGVLYGIVNTKIVGNDNGEEEKKATFKSDTFNNYARFIVDVISEKIIFSKKLDCFVFVRGNEYEIIDEIKFNLKYPVKEKKYQMADFLEVMEAMYRDHLKIEHDYNFYPYAIAGNDWIYDCKKLIFTNKTLTKNDLYAVKYPVNASEINTDIPKKFFELVTDNDKSKHNLQLIHAYTVYRKMKLIQAEKWFLMKDFGRSGKGLFMTTFEGLLQVNKINFDNLLSRNFESANEWMNFYGADIAHANETGEITKDMMNILRKVATAEYVSGRGIGKDAFRFKNRAVLILDTNEHVDTGEITANTTRTVKISLKDRPINETDEERYTVFEPFWNFVQPDDEVSIAAAVSFLITSLDYLKESGREFKFNNVTLKNYFSEDELTETQAVMVKVLSKKGFIFSGDPILQKLIEEDYKSLRYKKAKEDMKRIGVSINNQKWIDGVNTKVHQVSNPELFNMALSLLSDD
ncbi:phage resistance protein [Staphylococcus equorum]|uniref:phage resistance protein n=1 Tax=Staphylococcus equorum TaxID=246432 RepID=UPI002040630D|nr:phage resistance protein [Staphylococcus equorum]MCM3071393.1 phage resistance protein [Staphylococcus equorum]